MKVTEKSLKARCTELNFGILKDTGFGVRVERIGSSYTAYGRDRPAHPVHR